MLQAEKGIQPRIVMGWFRGKNPTRVTANIKNGRISESRSQVAFSCLRVFQKLHQYGQTAGSPLRQEQGKTKPGASFIGDCAGSGQSGAVVSGDRTPPEWDMQAL